MTTLAAGLAESLLQLVVLSTAAGIGITAAYSIVLLGLVRSQEASRGGRASRRWGWAGVAAVALVVFVAMLAVGMRIVAS